MRIDVLFFNVAVFYRFFGKMATPQYPECSGHYKC